MNNLEKLKLWYQIPRNRSFTIAMSFMILIVAISIFFSSGTTNESDSTLPETADTYIPEGFVLVPIELQNVDSISSLVGDVAIVDLFQGPESKKVGKRLRLMRAPLNPSQYAVLVSENEVQRLLASPGPYWAVIQNPNQSKKSVISDRSKKSRIEYFSGR